MSVALEGLADTPSSAAEQRSPRLIDRGLPVVFFLSGFAALLYQVVWQRALYTIIGINIESVTVVVTAFLLGLGLGSLAGGALSRAPGRPLVTCFVMIECGIALFGVFSLDLFHRAGVLALTMSAASTAGLVFLVVLIPTLLMGSTLPLLVAYAVGSSANVGRSVGRLYFVNTAGSALASIAAVMGILRHFGEHGTVLVAAVFNVTASLSAALLQRLQRS